MSVISRIIGENDGSDEYLAAIRLSQIINDSLPANSMGEIILYPSATFYGQAVKDVDIMMIGNIKNYVSRVKFTHDGHTTEEDVYLQSFCTTIEVKSHSVSSIRIEGTNFQVFYSNTGWHNATRQSNEQKVSAMNFFVNTFGESPYITNLLWFVEVGENELIRLLSSGSGIMPSNALPSVFDFSAIVEKIALQRIPKKIGSHYVIDSGFNGRDADAISKPLLLFSKAKNGVGELTRKRIEQIVGSELEDNSLLVDSNALNIFRGRAGTGKTIKLIKYAIGLVDSQDARVQILTYNRALVSDIRRLFALAELPDVFQPKCIAINTMQSYFYGLINGCLYSGKLSGTEFLNRYEELLLEMISFLKSDEEARTVIREICEDNPKLNWDYILIDEAQDWTDKERDLVLLLYDKNRIIIADGGQQFVRSVEPCDWTTVSKRNSIKLKYCLRQKRNLVRFTNRLAELIDPGSGKIVPSEKLFGGKVIVVRDKNLIFRTLKNEKNELKKAGNEPYDFLIIVPPSLVEEKQGNRSFKLKGEFEKNGFLLWDGTNEDHRLEYSINMEESRVLQYESARGLEGWTVCCMKYDEYLSEKAKQISNIKEPEPLFLESIEERQNRSLLNWALIPLTRAIDTLIITLDNEESQYGKMIISLAKEYPDYIQII